LVVGRRHSFGLDTTAAALGAAKSFDEAGDRCVRLQSEALEFRSIERAAMPAAHTAH